MIVFLINITRKPVPGKYYIYRRTQNGVGPGGSGGGGGGGGGVAGARRSKVSEEGCMQAVKYIILSGISHYDRMRRGS